jgi:hypothetical protein
VSGRRLPTYLHRKRWLLSGTGTVRLVDPTLQELAEIDDRWPPMRRGSDWHHSWRWQTLTKDKPEVFALSDGDGRLLSIWCSAKSKPIRLEGSLYYRPDYLEVAPEVRGKAVGAFTFLLIAARALELGATGLALGTWPFLRGFYAGMGGVERRPRGWNLARNLVPFIFDLETLTELKRLLDGKEHHGETAPDV